MVENNGEDAVTGLRVQFFDLFYPVGDLQYIGWISNITVPAKGNVTVSVWWIPQVDGERELKIILDPENRVEESDEVNNDERTSVDVELRPGQGLLAPIPRIQDVWIQLTVMITCVIIVGGTVLYEKLSGQSGAKRVPLHKKAGRKKGRSAKSRR